MQCSYEHSLLWVQLLLGVLDEVAVVQDPGYDLDLLAPHPLAGDPEVVSSVALGTPGQQIGNISLVLEHDVGIALRWRGRTVLAWPLNPDWSTQLILSSDWLIESHRCIFLFTFSRNNLKFLGNILGFKYF